MNRETVFNILKEAIGYAIVVTVLGFIAEKLGWIQNFGVDFVIAITIGWLIAKIILTMIDKNKKGK